MHTSYNNKFVKFIKNHNIKIKTAAKWLGVKHASLHNKLWRIKHTKNNKLININYGTYIMLIHGYKKYLESKLDKINVEPSFFIDFNTKKYFKSFIKKYEIDIKFVAKLSGYYYSSLRSNNTRLKGSVMDLIISRLKEHFNEELNLVNEEIKKIDI